MSNNEKYDILADRQTGIPSSMGIIPSGGISSFSEQWVHESLKNKDFTLQSFKNEGTDEPEYTAEINYKGTDFIVKLYITPTSKIGLEDYGFGNQIEKTDFDTAQQQPYFLETSMFFGNNALESFHLQLKIMNAIVPKASLVVDFTSYRLLSARWLSMTAKSHIPPSPDYLYTLHAVYNDQNEEKQYWLHTHGLLRCGSVELEIFNVTDGAQQMHDLIMMVVKKFMKDPARENEIFQIGYDGLGINLTWIRWENAILDLPDGTLGGKEDRQENNVHSEPSGVLYAVEDGNLVSPQIYASTLSDNPIYYISNEETERMRGLATERFSFFRDVFEKHHPVKENKSFFKKLFGKTTVKENGWGFLVKLGLNVDSSSAETEKEHLWFEVVSIEQNYITGKLLNQPYWIAQLKEGDINRYPLKLLTDWIIYSPEGNSYTTDSIYQLGYS